MKNFKWNFCERKMKVFSKIKFLSNKHVDWKIRWAFNRASIEEAAHKISSISINNWKSYQRFSWTLSLGAFRSKTDLAFLLGVLEGRHPACVLVFRKFDLKDRRAVSDRETRAWQYVYISRIMNSCFVERTGCKEQDSGRGWKIVEADALLWARWALVA